jgi:hypothetical protein
MHRALLRRMTAAATQKAEKKPGFASVESRFLGKSFYFNEINLRGA